MIDHIVLAVIAFAQVFALGFQSRNVNHGNYRLAMLTSFAIGICQAAVWRRVTAADSGWLDILIFAAAGAVGIVASMAAHDRFVVRKGR